MKDAAMVTAGAVLLIAAATLTIVLVTSPEPPPESDGCWHHPEEQDGETWLGDVYIGKDGAAWPALPQAKGARWGVVAISIAAERERYRPVFAERAATFAGRGEECSSMERKWARRKDPPCIVWRSDSDCAIYGEATP